eukprot:TRINITY_DN3690_c0_g1_i3.p1 TRINITY_DN3690_c0_g1~~TRINITY_DN3690_c0_g1_i3.p1  ORF type:complete len:207 (-),score=24.36 TRINITY_DN3690_c0_g1_i3:67-687(-)
MELEQGEGVLHDEQLLGLIAVFVGVPGIARMHLVCRHWRQLLHPTRQHFWHNVYRHQLAAVFGAPEEDHLCLTGHGGEGESASSAILWYQQCQDLLLPKWAESHQVGLSEYGRCASIKPTVQGDRFSVQSKHALKFGRTYYYQIDFTLCKGKDETLNVINGCGVATSNALVSRGWHISNLVTRAQDNTTHNTQRLKRITYSTAQST